MAHFALDDINPAYLPDAEPEKSVLSVDRATISGQCFSFPPYNTGQVHSLLETSVAVQATLSDGEAIVGTPNWDDNKQQGRTCPSDQSCPPRLDSLIRNVAGTAALRKSCVTTIWMTTGIGQQLEIASCSTIWPIVQTEKNRWVSIKPFGPLGRNTLS